MMVRLQVLHPRLLVTSHLSSLPTDPVVFEFNPPTYSVNEGATVVAFVVANRLFENGPFPVTVTSVDGTAECM